ncbi:hypothetical protein GLYMA_06G109000v4 [Glycine max]|nr:hypothetical protein GLYMA_06G109000v4 [Glycine max]KAH1125273.1 hypothetical protein GYH30_014725 [Glycine max]
MAKVGKLRSKAQGQRATPHLLSCARKNLKDVNVRNNSSKASEKKDWEDATCSVCMEVKGWTVVEAARKSLNAKKRSCMQDDCSFVGNYKELRKHVRSKHPFARPREVDPIKEEKWKRFECERERSDVISTILSSTPGAMVLGDYVLEPNDHAFYSDEYDSDSEYLEDDFFSSVASTGSAAVSGRGLHRILLGRSRRRRRHRIANARR